MLTSLGYNLPATALIQSSQASTIKTASGTGLRNIEIGVAAGLNVCANVRCQCSVSS